jgi:hypothetical protein
VANVFLTSFTFMESSKQAPSSIYQNFAEGKKIGDTKRLTGVIMDRTWTQARLWLLCLLYVIFLLNHLTSDTIGGLTLLKVAAGQCPDILALFQFAGSSCPYSIDHSFPSDSLKQSGYWVDITEIQGDTLTYLILTNDTNKVITHSVVPSDLDPKNPNLRDCCPSPSSGDMGSLYLHPFSYQLLIPSLVSILNHV